MLSVFKQVGMVCMGNQPTVFYLYGRLKETDRWEGQPLHCTLRLQAMGRFEARLPTRSDSTRQLPRLATKSNTLPRTFT